MSGIKKNIFSLSIFLVFALTIILENALRPPGQILTFDTFGYYLYLPGTFIYHQLDYTDPSRLEKLNEHYHFTGTFYQFVRSPKMRYLDKYTMGLAILLLPFFLIAHLIAVLWGFPIDGLSPPYQYTLLVGGLIYSMIGVFILRKILLKYFSDVQTAITMALVIFGTNYIYEAMFKGLMPHNLLFTFYTLLIWFTILWYEKREIKYAIFIGLTTGILTLSRPSEIVCIIIPLFWGVTDRKSLKERLAFWRLNVKHLLIAALVVLIIWIPQLIFWKILAGKFLYYSYDNPGEGFDFLQPHTIKFLFSFRKGWLIYSPLMIFSLIGFYSLFKKNRGLFWPLLIYFILNLYLVSSWTCWWYAQSYGQRAMIQSYAVIALPMGYFVQDLIHTRKKFLVTGFVILSLALITLNGFQIWQLLHNILDPSRITRAYYFATFGRTSVSDAQKKLLLVKRPSPTDEVLTVEGNYQNSQLALLDFEDRDKEKGQWGLFYDSLIVYSGRYSFRMDSAMQYSPGFDIKFKDLTKQEYAWARASVYIYPTADIVKNDALLVMTFDHRGKYYKYRFRKLSDPIFNAKPAQWNRITEDYITPEPRSKNDKLSVYVWYRGKAPIYVDDLKVEKFEKKK